MKAPPPHAGDLSRRRFVARTASALLGVGLLPDIFPRRAFAADEPAGAPLRPATAKNVIYLFMGGGQSHLDTWDPKEGVEAAGPTKLISTSAEGIRIAEHLPRTAKQMHQATLLRSLVSTQGAHEQGVYYMRTSYTLRGTIRHPSMGAWLTHLQGGGNPTLPKSVFIGNDSQDPGAGFFPAAEGPFFVSNPENGIKNAALAKGLTDEQLAARLALARDLDQEFRAAFPHRGVKAYAEMYDHAITLMKSEDLRAFDLTGEPDEMRAAYGRESFGQGCLLARRLVERGVRFVEVSLGGWDTHTANFVRVPELCDTLDRALAALLSDLQTRGLLKETLVVVATEFGRTPTINANVGRDHHPQAFSALMAGGGVKAGYLHGRTDKEGREVEEGELTIPDFNATIACALGLPLTQTVFSPSQRPFTVADKGKPVLEVFA
jgi:hypothetical protein